MSFDVRDVYGHLLELLLTLALKACGITGCSLTRIIVQLRFQL